jgi:hypothetical protein
VPPHGIKEVFCLKELKSLSSWTMFAVPTVYITLQQRDKNEVNLEYDNYITYLSLVLQVQNILNDVFNLNKICNLFRAKIMYGPY